MENKVQYGNEADFNGVNFNSVAWYSPRHGDRFEFQPNDKWYNEIIEWLKSATETVYVIKNDVVQGAKCVTKRLYIPGCGNYHVIASYYPDTKGIFYLFREAGTYMV